MQGDAFPTPPIYTHQFQPRLVQLDAEPQQDRNLTSLLDAIEQLMTDCSLEESQSFWSATDRIKIKHRVTESMQKIESLFLDLARASTQDPELISVVSENLRYTSNSQVSDQAGLDIPNFLKQRAC
jgi:organic radical activating enzyme